MSNPVPQDPPVLLMILALGLIVVLQFPISRVCKRNQALAAWRPLLIFASVAWGMVFLIRGIFLHDVWISDGVPHELAAREVADLVRGAGLDAALPLLGVGNDGLRFMTGLFYAYTEASRSIVIVLFTYLAFSGLLILTDIIIRSTGATRAPFWFVFLMTFYPEAFFWCIDLLKEGPVLWGLATVLQLMVPDPQRNTLRHKLWFCWGGVVGVFLRPHIMFAWLVAMGLAKAIKPRQIFAASFIIGGAVVAFMMMQVLAPALLDAALRRGTVESLEGAFRARYYDPGSAIRYVGGVPTPVVSGLILLFLRPFPHEAPHVFGVFAGAEVWFLSMVTFVSWMFLKQRRKYLMLPLVLTSVLAIVFLSFFFSYMSNMGLMVRYRMQVFPAMVCLAATPGLVRRSPSYSPNGLRRVHPNGRPVYPVGARQVQPWNSPVPRLPRPAPRLS